MKKCSIEELLTRYPELSANEDAIRGAIDALCEMYRAGGKLLIAGNGGSAADAEHIAGELLKGFLSLRAPAGDRLTALTDALGERGASLQEGIPAIPLASISGALTAFVNDVDPSLMFAQLTFALGRPADVFLGISTSGNAKNVVDAMKTARAMGLTTIALTGQGGGALAALADIAIRVPATDTYRVQEYHLPVYHVICAETEHRLFPGGERS